MTQNHSLKQPKLLEITYCMTSKNFPLKLRSLRRKKRGNLTTSQPIRRCFSMGNCFCLACTRKESDFFPFSFFYQNTLVDVIFSPWRPRVPFPSCPPLERVWAGADELTSLVIVGCVLPCGRLFLQLNGNPAMWVSLSVNHPRPSCPLPPRVNGANEVNSINLSLGCRRCVLLALLPWIPQGQRSRPWRRPGGALPRTTVARDPPHWLTFK